MSHQECENDSDGEVSRGRAEHHDTVSPFSILVLTYKYDGSARPNSTLIGHGSRSNRRLL